MSDLEERARRQKEVLEEIRDELVSHIDGGWECRGRDTWLTGMIHRIEAVL